MVVAFVEDLLQGSAPDHPHSTAKRRRNPPTHTATTMSVSWDWVTTGVQEMASSDGAQGLKGGSELRGSDLWPVAIKAIHVDLFKKAGMRGIPPDKKLRTKCPGYPSK